MRPAAPRSLKTLYRLRLSHSGRKSHNAPELPAAQPPSDVCGPLPGQRSAAVKVCGSTAVVTTPAGAQRGAAAALRAAACHSTGVGSSTSAAGPRRQLQARQSPRGGTQPAPSCCRLLLPAPLQDPFRKLAEPLYDSGTPGVVRCERALGPAPVGCAAAAAAAPPSPARPPVGCSACPGSSSPCPALDPPRSACAASSAACIEASCCPDTTPSAAPWSALSGGGGVWWRSRVTGEAAGRVPGTKWPLKATHTPHRVTHTCWAGLGACLLGSESRGACLTAARSASSALGSSLCSLPPTPLSPMLC